MNRKEGKRTSLASLGAAKIQIYNAQIQPVLRTWRASSIISSKPIVTLPHLTEQQLVFDSLLT
jgi:hypothetical protein